VKESILTKRQLNTKVDKTMNTNSYLKPAWTHNGSVRTDLPLTVIGKTKKRKLMEIVRPGQLCCVGKVYLRTGNGLIRIK
jgi:hypothetical protein